MTSQVRPNYMYLGGDATRNTHMSVAASVHARSKRVACHSSQLTVPSKVSVVELPVYQAT